MKSINLKYCECGCKGFTTTNTCPYDYWIFLHVSGEFNGLYIVYRGHGFYGHKVGSSYEREEIENLIIEDMKKRIKIDKITTEDYSLFTTLMGEIEQSQQ